MVAGGVSYVCTWSPSYRPSLSSTKHAQRSAQSLPARREKRSEIVDECLLSAARVIGKMSPRRAAWRAVPKRCARTVSPRATSAFLQTGCRSWLVKAEVVVRLVNSQFFLGSASLEALITALCAAIVVFVHQCDHRESRHVFFSKHTDVSFHFIF